MIKKVQKIIVVGGGSAGWMSASFLKKALPDKEVIVIESPNIPTIGVGESTLGGIKPFLNFLEIDEFEMMKATDASYKMSIKFTNFYKNDGTGFHYPFGIPFEEDTIDGSSDWLIKKTLYPETPVQDFVHCFSPASFLFENNQFDLNHSGLFDNFNPSTDVAYHFDAIKFATYLRERYSKIVGIKHILATVVDVITNEDGIKELIVDSGEKIDADLYVDCTGFKSLLIGKTLKEDFYDFNHVLPNNRAWAAQVPYKDKELELEGFTNCTAIQNGWVWNTPIWSRLGAGYVYSDKYVDPENAKEEFKQYLMSQMVCKRSREEIEDLKFRDIPFRVGAYKKSFVKNVVAIGMAAGFIEPLESNGLYTVHEFLFRLIQILKRDFVTQIEKDMYNHAVYQLWLEFSHFVGLHYQLSGRTDTQYWNENIKRSMETFDQQSRDLMLKNSYFNGMFFTHKFADRISGINWISVGMNCFYINDVILKAHRYDLSRLKFNFDKWEKRKFKWEMAARNSLRLIDHQKTYIYGETL